MQHTEAAPRTVSPAGFFLNLRPDYSPSSYTQDPANASVLSNFANFMFKCRNKPEVAKELYVRALRADPNHKMASRNYACFLRDCPEMRCSSKMSATNGCPLLVQSSRRGIAPFTKQ